MMSVPRRPNEAEQPDDKEAAVPGIAAGTPLPQRAEPRSVPIRGSAGNPRHSKKPVPDRFREPFILVRDVTFGGELADEESLSFGRKIIPGRADDNPAP